MSMTQRRQVPWCSFSNAWVCFGYTKEKGGRSERSEERKEGRESANE